MGKVYDRAIAEAIQDPDLDDNGGLQSGMSGAEMAGNVAQAPSDDESSSEDDDSDAGVGVGVDMIQTEVIEEL